MSIIVFNSTHHALLAEKALEEAGVPIDIVPLPIEFAADCGLSIEFDAERRQVVEETLAARGIEYKGIFDYAGD